jgi:transposase
MKTATPNQTVAIRPFTREEALSHLKANPDLVGNVFAMAKAWRRSRSTVREWQRAWQQQGDLPTPSQQKGRSPVGPVSPAPEVATLAIDMLAYVAAIGLAGVAGYLSISGLVVLFPGVPVAVTAMAATMEAAKLITSSWLARHWRSTSRSLRFVLISLVVGLAIVNAAGVYGRLVEAHVTMTVAATSSVAERIAVLDARLEAQRKSVADADRRLDEINAAISKLTEKGRPGAALDAIANQRRQREALATAQQKESGLLVELRSDRATLEAQRQRAEALDGPIQYIAAMAGVDVERAIRWLILLMVATCDPLAIALMVVAAGSQSPGGKRHGVPAVVEAVAQR